MKPLDIVTIDTGAVGVVLEGDTYHCSIRWFGRTENKCAWWAEGERGLRVIDNLAAFLTDNLRHPFSGDRRNPYFDGLAIYSSLDPSSAALGGNKEEKR